MSNNFQHYSQLDAMDCGPTCLRMIAKYYGRTFSLQELRRLCFITKEGSSLLGISDAAESIGIRTQGVIITPKQLRDEVKLPCILHWNQNHFVVCYKISRQRFNFGKRNQGIRYHIADPASGKAVFTEREFLKCWSFLNASKELEGIALLLEPAPEFYNQENSDDTPHLEKKLAYFIKYITPHKSQLTHIFLATLGITLIQLVLPFLSQSIVDNGIGNQDLGLITLILISQFVLFFTQLSVDFLRTWIMLYITARINISLISDFLIKLMRLPMKYFDTKMIGDIMQRINDHQRIQSFLTGSSINFVFSSCNFILFSCILAYFNTLILVVFMIGNTLYVVWILAFMKFRRELDQKRFAQASSEQSSIVELIYGMQEIKLSNSEKQKRWKWERIQVKLFKITMKGLTLRQYQQTGSSFFTQMTSLLISYIAARAVVEGRMTLGMMVSLTYIIGQLAAPLSQFVNFLHSSQDAKISLERLGEIHNREDETNISSERQFLFPSDKTIHVNNIWFSYDGADRDYVLHDVSLEIPQNKTTAIVGASGSEKTTLMKLMLGFYVPNKGSIKVGGTSIEQINKKTWRSKVGVVMQDGYIFSDTIAGNIAVGDENINQERMYNAVQTANIQEYIESLPLSYNTKIGIDGKGVSQGQRQRLLIARAIYKNPDFLFFDEATNSLDATNEKLIMKNIEELYHNKTIIVIAHRLSTVQNADNIVVLGNGEIVEQGTHQDLIQRKGEYYKLIRNQLELGS